MIDILVLALYKQRNGEKLDNLNYRFKVLKKK